MKLFVSMILALLVATIFSGSLQAKVGDKAWTSCVWNIAPVSASTWLKMESPTWNENMDSASERLGFRIFAICNIDAVDQGKPNRMPNWNSLRATLKSAKPKTDTQLASVLDQIETADVQTKFCEHFVLGDSSRSLYLTDVVRAHKGVSTVVFQQYFSKIGDGSLAVSDGKGRAVSFEFAGVPAGGSKLRMPQELKVTPSVDAKTETICKNIDSSGALTNA